MQDEAKGQQIETCSRTMGRVEKELELPKFSVGLGKPRAEVILSSCWKEQWKFFIGPVEMRMGREEGEGFLCRYSKWFRMAGVPRTWGKAAEEEVEDLGEVESRGCWESC